MTEDKLEQKGAPAAATESTAPANDGPPAQEASAPAEQSPSKEGGGEKANKEGPPNVDDAADDGGEDGAPEKEDVGETSPDADGVPSRPGGDPPAPTEAADAPKDDGGDDDPEGNPEGGAGTKRKEVDDGQKPTTVPDKIPKKARTAYFIFADEKRPEIQAAHPGETVGVIAKYIGQMWGDLSDEDKQTYQVRAAEEKEKVAKQMEVLREAGLLPDAAAASSGPSGSTGFILPVARIRKICKLDPEVRGLSKEGVILITKASELFTAKLGREAVAVAAMQNRRKILADDISMVCSTKEEFLFLQNDIKDLTKEQKESQEEKAAAAGGDSKSKKADAAVSGVQPLTSYFGASTTSSASTSKENKEN